jgi:hypothetical protein
MEWVVIVVLLVLLIGGFVAFLVLNASKKSGPVAGDEGPPGIGPDETPLGDTTEHAGDTTEHGTTVGSQDAEESGGTGRPVHSGEAETSAAGRDVADPDAAAHLARPGEGEGRERLGFEGTRPAGEQTEPAGAPAARPAESGEAGDDTGPGATSEAAESPADGARKATERDDTRPDSERLADRGF